MKKRTMTTDELMMWVELADTGQEQAERAASANAGYPEMVTMLDASELAAWMSTHASSMRVWSEGLMTIEAILLKQSLVAADAGMLNDALLSYVAAKKV
jgi:hypothetical protein